MYIDGGVVINPSFIVILNISKIKILIVMNNTIAAYTFLPIYESFKNLEHQENIFDVI